MTRERVIRLVAGSMVLLSIVPGWSVSQWWLLLGVFVGLNLLQSSFTKWCLLDDILKKAGVKSGAGDGKGGSCNTLIKMPQSLLTKEAPWGLKPGRWYQPYVSSGPGRILSYLIEPVRTPPGPFRSPIFLPSELLATSDGGI